MLRFSLRNRIAFYYIISTALLIFAVFVVLYNSVKAGIYDNIENDINIEMADLLEEITIRENGFQLSDPEEWLEKEHITLDVNPIFVEFTDSEGNMFEKSPNLKHEELTAVLPLPKSKFYNATTGDISVRQRQIPIRYRQKTVGYIIVAEPLEDARSNLMRLLHIMIVAYPLILIALYLLARFFAGKSIKPVQSIIQTSERITRDNLSERIALPENKDELYALAVTTNELLDRIESAIEREKQFTSDASHELRTPLSVIKGTLEVLIRKPREREEYENKIYYCINEVNRINHLVDQLLLLARFENHKKSVFKEKIYINPVIHDAFIRNSANLKANGINVAPLSNTDFYAYTDSYLLSIIIDNIISNAAKYAGNGAILTVECIMAKDSTDIVIRDTGKGISKEDMQKIYNRFYRSKESETTVKGTGLGLSIVKRLCGLLDIKIDIVSEEGSGTVVTLLIP